MERRLIIVLFVALGIALLTIGYLAGRASVEPVVVTRATDVAVITPAATPPAPVASTPLTPPPATAEPPSAMTEIPTPPPAASAATARPTPPAFESIAADDALIRPEVVRYFAEVDLIQAAAKSATGDPEALAQVILKHATDGDMREFDALLKTQRGLSDRLRAIVPPSPCAEHLHKSVAAVDDGIAILQKTRDALVMRDFSELSSLTTVGQDLERRAREVDALGAALKKRFAI
jgi:hypothetical protein